MDKIETKHDDGGGSAYPSEQGHIPDGTWNQTYEPGMSVRQYAAIKLKVPDSGTDWLDEMIYESLRNEYAGHALAGTLANNEVDFLHKDCAELCAKAADAMIEEERKREPKGISPERDTREVYYLGFGPRINSALRRAGIQTIADLVEFTPERLRAEVKNFGNTSYREVKRKLEAERGD